MNEEEIWKPHPEFLDHEVSSLGRVRRYLKPFFMTNGYLHVSLGAVKKRRNLHTLVMEAFIGPRPAGMVVRHLDGNKANPRLANLAYGTYEENAADRIAHTGGNRGSLHGLSKLTEEDVRSIRARYKPWQVTMKMLAGEYGVTPDCIKRIVTGTAWKHLPCRFESTRSRGHA